MILFISTSPSELSSSSSLYAINAFFFLPAFSFCEIPPEALPTEAEVLLLDSSEW